MYKLKATFRPVLLRPWVFVAAVVATLVTQVAGATTSEGVAEKVPLKDRLDAQAAAIDEVLEQTAPKAGDRDLQRCVYGRTVKQTEVLDQRHILVWGSHKRVWLNRLSGRCMGLERSDLLAFERHGSQLCQHDRFRAADRFGRFDEFASTCWLGEFELITEQQAEALRESLSTQRDNVRVEVGVSP